MFSTILVFYINWNSADAEDLQVYVFLDLNNESTSRAKSTSSFYSEQKKPIVIDFLETSAFQVGAGVVMNILYWEFTYG